MQHLMTHRVRASARLAWVWAALLVSLFAGPLAQTSLAQAANTAQLTPHDFVSTVDSSHVLTVTFDLANTGTAPATSPEITATALRSTSNQPIGTRQSPASLPASLGDLAVGASEPVSVSFGPVTSGQRAKFSIALSCTGANVSTGFYLTIPTAAVAKLTAAPGNGSVTLTYQIPADASYYNVYESTDPNGTFTYIGYSSSTTYTQSGLTNGTTYYYYVIPYFNSGAGTQSNTASALVSLPPPTDLTATPGNGLVTLNWTASDAPGASYYNVYESSDPNAAPSAYAYIGYSGSTTYTQSGLTNGVTYYYYLVPYNNGGAGTPSDIVSTTVTLAPVTNLKATPGNGLINLTWNAQAGDSYFDVYESTSKTGAYTYIGYTGGDSATSYGYTQTGLTNGTTYYYYVVAYNNGASSPNSTIASATLSLAAVTNLVATPGNGQVTLAWNAPKGLNYFNVYESTSATAPKSAYTYIGYTGGSATATTYGYQQTGLNNGTTYYYYIVPYNNGGPGAASEIASATPILGAVTNLTAVAGNGLINLTWNAPAGLSYFNVYASTDPHAAKSAYTYIGYTGGSSATSYSYQQSGLANGTTYYYYVVAYNSGGPGASSSIVSATPTLNAVTNLAATAGNGLINLTWNAPAGLNYFNVYESTSKTGAYTYIGYTGGDSATSYGYTQTGLTNGTTYYYYVVPYNNGGPGAASKIASATPTLAAVTSLAAAPGNGQVTLTWKAPAGLNYFNVYASTSATAAPSTYTYIGYTGGSSATSYSYQQTGLTNGTTYYYYVVAYNNGGSGALSAIVFATVSLAPVTGLKAAKSDGSVTLTWNAPAGLNYFNVYASTSATAAPSTYTYIGYTGGSGTATSYSFQQSGLDNGTTYYYYVVPYNNGGAGTASGIVHD